MATSKKTEVKEAEVVKSTKAKKVSSKDVKKDVKKVAKSVGQAAKDLRTLTEQELHEVLATAKEDLMSAQKMLRANELPGSHVIKKSKQFIARVHTVLTEVKNNKEAK